MKITLYFKAVTGAIAGIASAVFGPLDTLFYSLVFCVVADYITGICAAIYEKKLDSFIRDWYLGNVRLENHTVYKFDFGGTEEKDYSQMLFRQGFAAEEMLVKAMKFLRPSTDAFTVRRGYGFDSADTLQNVDRGEPDALRQDFAEGDAPAEFLIEVPRGQYELLVISGDEKEDSVTALEAVGGRSCGGNVVKAGTWQCELIPVIHERDGMITLRLSTKPGYKWKLNAILMNMVKQF